MINIIATLRFNIKAFGLVQGLHLPVFIYGRIKIKSIGNIKIKCPLRRRLIVIGTHHNSTAAPCSVFNNTGIVEVYGKVFLNYGCVFTNRGTVILRGNDLIGDRTDIDIVQHLDMGHDVSIGFETHITDTDHHYVVDVNTKQVKRNDAPIRIGNFNWFGSNTYIKKGTITADYLMVASPYSMLSKDYSALPPNTVLAGCPAKPIKEGIRRVYNFQNEATVREYFLQHPEANAYQLEELSDLDDFCRLS